MDLEGLKGLNFVMRDRQTGSLWQQATGIAFEGPLKGKRLELVDFLLTTWGEWRKLHPDTLAVLPDPKYLNRYRATGQIPDSRIRWRTAAGSTRDETRRRPAVARPGADRWHRNSECTESVSYCALAPAGGGER